MNIIQRFFYRGINRLSWLYDSFLWGFFRLFPPLAWRVRTDLPVTIGITTFLNRYELFFKPLVRKLMFLFPESRIIVAANGSVLRDKQQEYIVSLKEFCSHFRNIELITYEQPMGLSHLWNRIIKKAVDDSVMMLNDDLRLRTGFGKFIERSGILREELATINSSWSHFLISQEFYTLVGEFDEELREIGGEDDDYLARLVMRGLRPADFTFKGIARSRKRRNRVPDINSYGKDMTKEDGGYSTYNIGYLRRKWEIADEYFEGAIEIPRTKNRYWKLKEHDGAG